MEEPIKELERIARELRIKDNELAREVREAGKLTQEGFDRVLSAIHKLHHYISNMPEHLTRITEQLRKQDT